MGHIPGDADIAAVAGALADRSRAKMLLALGDGRALAATTLAMEAGVAPSTASAHLAKLVSAGLLVVEHHGRHRYYRMARQEVGELLETLARLAPPSPVRSLREGTRANALRAARTCYDHLAGQLGTAIMAAFLDREALVGGDGTFHPASTDPASTDPASTDSASTHPPPTQRDRLSAPGWDCDYRVTEAGRTWMDELGVKVPVGTGRPLIRYCVDWSEQRHHLAGALGAALLVRLTELGWLRRSPTSRAVHVTDAGRCGLATSFGVELA
ncbi:MAG: ArsR/SmtB family transcription factor [Candidatus Dormibacteria bacterium]